MFRSSASLGGAVIAFRAGGALYRALFLGGKSSVPGGVDAEGDGLGKPFLFPRRGCRRDRLYKSQFSQQLKRPKPGKGEMGCFTIAEM